MQQQIIIIGAGLAGMTMAIAAAKAGSNVIVIESSDLNTINSKTSDGRTCAIAYGSAKFFEHIGVWDKMKKHAGAIDDIRVTDCNSPLFLHYDHKLLGDEPMGYIIENYYLREALFEKAAAYKNIKIIDKENILEVNNQASSVEVKTSSQKFTANLLIVADGRISKTREMLGIKTIYHDFEQTGIVCTVEHEKNHENTAQERFLPAGPFAILPMQGGHHSSLVWTEETKIAKLLASLPEDEFMTQLQKRFGDYLGQLKLVGKVFTYPLVLAHARKYTATRAALIGDAAHGIHPLAGQGFNLGIRDIELLYKLISKNIASGIDIGSENILNEYEKLRKFDSLSLIAITNWLNRIFLNKNLAVKTARRLGMAAVNKTPALKKIFMKHAMGMV